MKASIRKINISKRNGLSRQYVNMAGEGILNAFMRSNISKHNSYMGYFPVNNEAPMMPVFQFLLAEGKHISLPVINSDDEIYPVGITDFNNMTMGKYNIPIPMNGNAVEVGTIDIVFVPGTAFDINGGRMGYGMGYYDRYLKKSDFLKVGVCYEFQLQRDLLPTENHDINMDYILTERGLYEV